MEQNRIYLLETKLIDEQNEVCEEQLIELDKMKDQLTI